MVNWLLEPGAFDTGEFFLKINGLKLCNIYNIVNSNTKLN